MYSQELNHTISGSEDIQVHVYLPVCSYREASLDANFML